MGVLGLHNECPPVNYSAEDAPEIVRGLILDQVATKKTLRVIGKAVEALAGMDDAVSQIVSAWGTVTESAGSMNDLFPEIGGGSIEGAIKGAFAALHGGGPLIDEAVQDYRELERYAALALTKGRGAGYEGTLRVLGEGGFAVLVRKRVELLRKLKIRFILLESLEPACDQIVADNNFPMFFTIFMEPLRDLAVASNALYSETIRGALSSYTAMLRSCELVGDDAVQEPVDGAPPVKPQHVHAGGEVPVVAGD